MMKYLRNITTLTPKQQDNTPKIAIRAKNWKQIELTCLTKHDDVIAVHSHYL
jgi:hypothetical protein